MLTSGESPIKRTWNPGEMEDLLHTIDKLHSPLKLGLLPTDLTVTALTKSDSLLAFETSYHTCDENKPACKP